jgi:hypothetical protein
MPTYVPWGFQEQTSPPLTLCTRGRGGAESTVKMREPEQPPFTGLPGRTELFAKLFLTHLYT